jgi:hypothetical protein
MWRCSGGSDFDRRVDRDVLIAISSMKLSRRDGAIHLRRYKRSMLQKKIAPGWRDLLW